MERAGRKARVFVGSSVESLRYAYAVQENLDPHDAEVKVWPQGVFQLADYTLESLLEALKSHDFGVFVFAADDILVIRDRRHGAVRDNVLFELGLFMGGLGRERTFILAPSGGDLHLPSDLLGWNIATYDPHREDHVAALGVACNKIRLAIQRRGIRRPSTWADTATDAPPADRFFISATAEPIEAKPPFPSVDLSGSPRQSIAVGPPKQASKPAKRRRRSA